MSSGSRMRGLAILVATVFALMFSVVGVGSAQEGVGSPIDTPGGETPVGETPGGETPGGETPGGETPGGETPGGETPGGETSPDGTTTPTSPVDCTAFPAAFQAQCRQLVAGGATLTQVITALQNAAPTAPSFPTLPTPSSSGASPTPAPSTSGVVPSGSDLNCSDFANPADAQAVLAQDPSDPNNLDADRDGIACDAGTASSPTTLSSSGFPTGGVASGDGTTGGLTVGQIVLLAMVGFTALAGAAKVVVVARVGKVA